MAKSDDPGFIEQHIEKLVLGAALVIFLIGLFTWKLAPSPTVQLRSGPVPSDKVDSRLLDRINDRIKDIEAQPLGDIPIPPKIADEIDKRINDPYPRDLGRVAALSEGFWKNEVAEESPDLLEIAHVDNVLAGPGIPVAGMTRGVLEIPKVNIPAGGAPLPDVQVKEDHIAITVCDFNIKDVRDILRTILKNTPISPRISVYDQETQVSMRRLADGPNAEWSQPISFASEMLPFEEDTRLGGRGFAPGPVAQKLTPPEIPDFDSNDPVTSATAISAALKLRHKWQEVLLQPGCRRFYNFKTRMTAPFVSWKTRLVETPGIKAMWDFALVKGSGGGVAPADPLLPKAAMVAPFAMQRQGGIIHVWSFYKDVKPGMEYKFRTRLKLINPLFTRIRDVKNPKDAEVKFISTKWSQWSKPESLIRDQKFFFVGGSTTTRQATLHVYTRIFDQMVLGKFNGVTTGAFIGGMLPINLINPHTGGVIEKQPVDFSTASLVVDLDFKVKVPRSGAVTSTETKQMYFLDPDNKLRSKLESADSVHPDIKYCREEANEVISAIKAIISGEAGSPDG